MINLDSKISELSRVGIDTAKCLKKIGIKTINDLLFAFPFRYDKYSPADEDITNLPFNEKINLVGTIEMIQSRRSWKRRMNITEAIVTNEAGSIKIIWFNQPFISKNLKEGDHVSFSGKIEEYNEEAVMKSPLYEKILSSNRTISIQGLVPIYHSTGNITQKQIRFFLRQAMRYINDVPENIPEERRKKLNLITKSEALTKIHFPETEEDIKKAQQRLGFDELFSMQLNRQRIKYAIKSKSAVKIPFLKDEIKKFVDSLEFNLTNSQKKAAWEILLDIQSTKPMTRILEGDVGSGKTVVALMCLLNTVLNKELSGQAILMVPTEILAKQHFNSIKELTKGLGIKIGLITAGNKELFGLKGNKTLNQQKIIDRSQIIIGTHSLIQDKVRFSNPLLIIIDEQHRFGVEQRKRLGEIKTKNNTIPHLLTMTATPIPRSLALTIYGDLDISVIDEMPENRKEIITKIIPEKDRDYIYSFIRKHIEDKKQVFVICPLIDESDKLGVKSVKQEYEKIKNKVFPDLKIGMLHSKLKISEKDKIMKDFLDNKINILVSTSVIEVGVDIPNANIIVIEGAERFGLAQLHQFRGRVGRGIHQSYCFLFTNSSLEKSPEKTQSRLKAMTKHISGFELAKIDLKLRGHGDLYGIIQSGFPELRIASIFDYELIKKARSEAEEVVKIEFENK